VVGSSGKLDISIIFGSEDVIAVIDGEGCPSLLGNVCAKSENSFAEGGVVINSNTSVGRSTNGRYTSPVSGMKDAGSASPNDDPDNNVPGEGILDGGLDCGLVGR
jgi:hypothetical protein